jgi:menaquinone-dependent protoporphyrinogen IX oxidase
VVQRRSIRNSVIIAVAAAASISASFAGYYAAEAQKFFALGNTAVTKAVKNEHQADLQVLHDEELLIQATIEYHKNETRIGDFLVGQVSDIAKRDMSLDSTNLSYSLPQKYYDDMYSGYESAIEEEHDYLARAELSDEYTKMAIISASLLTAGIVIFSEFTRKESV